MARIGTFGVAQRLVTNALNCDLQRRLIERVARNGLPVADQAIVSGANFLTTIIVARALGPTEFGVYSLAWIVVLFVGSMQIALISAPMMSIGPKQDDGEKPAYFAALLAQQAVYTTLCISLVATCSVLGMWLFPGWELTRFALPLSAAAAACQLQDFFRRYFYARHRTKAVLVVDSICYLGRLTALLSMFALDALTITTALWSIVAASVAAILISVCNLGSLAYKPERFGETLRRHWRFSRWMAGSEALRWSTNNLFIIAAGSQLGAAAVGAIKASQSLLGINNIMLQAIVNVVAVRSSVHFQHGGNAGLVAYLRRISWGGGGVTIAIALVCAAAPEFWLTLLFGENYAGYGDLVRWYSVIYLLIFSCTIVRMGLRAVEHTRPIFLALLRATIFSVIFAFPLVSWLGLTGVMGGLLTAQCIRQLTLWKAFRSRMREEPQ